MSRPVRALLASALVASLLSGCLAPVAAPPPPAVEPTPAPRAVVQPVQPTLSPTDEPELPAPPPEPVACDAGLIDWLAAGLEDEPSYAYSAAGWNEYNTGSRRGNGRHRAELAFEGARDGELRWWRRVSGGPELYDEAVGDSSAAWTRLPFWRSWQPDGRGKVEIADPLAELLAVEGWEARRIDEGCLLWAIVSGMRAARDYTLLLDEFGQPLTMTSAGMRPQAPVGEGVPAAWWIEYEFVPDVPMLPSLPPQALPASNEVALAMLAANDAPGSEIIWRDSTERDQVLAFNGPGAYGFIAWDADGGLTEAAIMDRPNVPADLLEFYRLGDRADESDDELYLVAIVLDERVTKLSLKVDGQARESVPVSAPGGLLGPLPDYLDSWRFFFEDGSRAAP